VRIGSIVLRPGRKRHWVSSSFFVLILSTKKNIFFQSSEVDMEALKLCSDADLTEMGLTVGPRVKIRNALQKMQETEEKWTDSDLTEF